MSISIPPPPKTSLVCDSCDKLNFNELELQLSEYLKIMNDNVSTIDKKIVKTTQYKIEINASIMEYNICISSYKKIYHCAHPMITSIEKKIIEYNKYNVLYNNYLNDLDKRITGIKRKRDDIELSIKSIIECRGNYIKHMHYSKKQKLD